MGLIVNESKTKYIVKPRQETSKNNLKINGYSYEQLQEFKYLEVNINKKNNMHDEVRLELSAANKSYYACLVKHGSTENVMEEILIFAKEKY